LNATGQRAIEIRVAHLEAFQAARHWEMERLYERSEVLVYELLNDQQALRRFRDLLFMRGRG
jgi:2-polyprenyl-6-methoxyphenol hydroxylase-like FAD-dependent oxidoreductase